MKNVISKTGQAWKFKTMFFVLVLSGVFIIYGQMNIDVLSNESYLYFVAGGAFTGILSFIIASLSVKCPNCGLRWFWAAVSSKNNKEWLIWLNSLSYCPKCGEPKSE